MAFLEALLGNDFRNLKDAQKNAFYFWFCDYLIANSANNHEVPKLVQQALSGDDNARNELRLKAQARALEMMQEWNA